MGIEKKCAGKHLGKAAFLPREPLAIRLFALALSLIVLLCGGLLAPILWTVLRESMQCRTDGQACNFVHHPKTLHDVYK